MRCFSSGDAIFSDCGELGVWIESVDDGVSFGEDELDVGVYGGFLNNLAIHDPAFFRHGHIPF